MALLYDLPTTVILAWLYVPIANHLNILLRALIVVQRIGGSEDGSVGLY